MAEQGDIGGARTLAPILLIVGLVAAGAAAGIVVPVANGIRSDMNALRSDLAAEAREIRTSVAALANETNEAVAALAGETAENDTAIAVLGWSYESLLARIAALEGAPAIAETGTGAGDSDSGG